MMKKNDTKVTDDENNADSSSSAEMVVEDIAFEEVIPEDSPPRKNLPDTPTIRNPSGKPIPVK
ncbi:MAG: hypothetical protein ACWA6R_05400 [Nitrosomonas sp.]